MHLFELDKGIPCAQGSIRPIVRLFNTASERQSSPHCPPLGQTSGVIDTVSFEIRRLTPPEFSLLAPQLVEIHIEAMNYNPAIVHSRISSWRRNLTRPGFSAQIATQDDGIVGVSYGFLGSPDSWWDAELRRGLRLQGGPTEEQWDIVRNYYELAEIHVLPQYQGHGLGKKLLEGLLWNAPAGYALLSTPEVPNEDNGAFRLYRSAGFFDVLRNHLYPADARPFAILGARLPL